MKAETVRPLPHVAAPHMQPPPRAPRGIKWGIRELFRFYLNNFGVFLVASITLVAILAILPFDVALVNDAKTAVFQFGLAAEKAAIIAEKLTPAIWKIGGGIWALVVSLWLPYQVVVNGKRLLQEWTASRKSG